MPIVALLTDYGTRDPYAAALKGVVLTLCPEAQLVDITHEIEPFNVAQGAFVLGQSWSWFPENTVFVAVVDPGVGSDRRILLARYAGRSVLAPDNGLLTWLHTDGTAEAIHVVENPRYSLPNPSATFQGRDILAAAAAHLANGVNPASFGPKTDEIELLAIPTRAEPNGSGWLGRVIYVDRFGTLVTNIRADQLALRTALTNPWTVYVSGKCIGPVRRAFHDVDPGAPLAFVGGSSLLEIALNRGGAAAHFGTVERLEIEVR